MYLGDMSHLLCAKHLHCVLLGNGVCLLRPGRCALWSWQLTEGHGRATGVPGASVRKEEWSYTSAPLLHLACAQASCCTVRWRGAGAYKRKKSQAGSCPRAWWLAGSLSPVLTGGREMSQGMDWNVSWAGCWIHSEHQKDRKWGKWVDGKNVTWENHQLGLMRKEW